MPDILILGMEMPTMEQAYKTLIISYDGKVYEGVHPQPTAKKKEPIAEAVELPPHGDLIDMDKIRYTELYGGVEVTTANWIDSLPVVAPAERRE